MADFNLAYAPVAKWEGGWTHDSGDMCGGFGSLAVQGFLAPFPAREPHGGERETV